MIKYEVELKKRIPYLVQEADYGECGRIENTDELNELLCSTLNLDRKAEENVFLIALTVKGEPIAVFLLSRGCLDMAICRPREVMMRLLMVGAASFVLAHNHPSGDITPSNMDYAACEACRKAGKMMNIPMLDFMIVSGDGLYFSMKAQGKLENRKERKKA